MKIIPHNKPCLDEKEVKAIEKIIKSQWLIMGQEVKKLEDNIKKLTQKRFALAVNSGTSALHLCLIALGIGSSDEVIIPTYTCSALLNATNYTGATPVIVDIENDGFNIDPKNIKKKLTSKTKAIIVPHTFGFPAKIVEIKKFNIPIIEDCAQALGSYYQNKALGAFGDISIFSFYATKMIATGQGGMLLTNNSQYFEIVKDLTDYNCRADYKTRYNYQLTDIQACIGNIQFNKLISFIKKRKYIASRFIDVLEKKNNILYFPGRQDKYLNHYRFIIQFKNERVRNTIKRKLNNLGITSIPPISTFELLHNLLRLEKSDFPNAQKLSLTTLSLPISPSVKEKEVDIIASALESLLDNN